MKFTLGQNQLTLTSAKTASATTRVLFTFGSNFLANAIKASPKIKLALLDDFGTDPQCVINYTDQPNIVVHLGDKAKFDSKKYKQALQLVANILNTNKKISAIDFILEEQIAALLKLDFSTYSEQTVFNLINGMYFFDAVKSSAKKISLTQINFVSKTEIKTEMHNAIAFLEGVFLVKDLGNNPANIVTPNYLADIATDMAKLSKKVTVKILDKKDAKKLKMHTYLAVSQGSAEEPKFITMSYNGGKANQKPIVLVGKGVTFDSGGISIKPKERMEEMKYDMLGAATVLGVFATVVKLGLPVNLTVLAPCTDNLPSGTAIKPGDIVTSMSGKTIEIVNTDAEGRLILCDVLHYAKRYKPALVIDIATLTGACIIALGNNFSALYSNNDKLATDLLQASKRSNDKLWQMPLSDDYDEALANSVADLSNMAGWGGAGGSAAAASFLAKFVDYNWAHLDIAGSGWVKGSYNGRDNKGGATGRPFYLLTDFIRNYC